MRDADAIIALGPDKRVALQGTFTELLESHILEHQDLLETGNETAGPAEPASDERSQEAAEPAPLPEVSDDSILPDARSRGTRSVSPYWYYMKAIGWQYGSLSIFLGIVDVFFQIFPRKSPLVLDEKY